MIRMAAIDPTFVLSNRLEAGLWVLIALPMAVAAVRRRHVRRECAIGATAFALFAASDLVETTTGAWWRPWWLLAWKSLCVAVLLALLVEHYRVRFKARTALPRRPNS